MQKSIEDVKIFWETNPLFSGESEHPMGSREFFEEHKRVYESDCFAGKIDERIFPMGPKDQKVLDLGCGPGFWTTELGLRGFNNLTGADLTETAIDAAKKRAEIYGIKAEFVVENAEKTTFKDEVFDHVNCLGVIHHTPSPQSCVREIARILKNSGTATISVYYQNWLLQQWPRINWLGHMLTKVGAGLKGRGRENIFRNSDVNEIVRLYDGVDNPIGYSYSYNDFIKMLEPYFYIESTFLHFFPARALPFKIPQFFHKKLNDRLGFLIVAKLRKRN